jgi:hypothetical protein
MSNISSTDGGYQYYNRKIGDLEDELRSENKRAQSRLSEQGETLEANYRKALENNERQANDTVDSIRRSSAEKADQERASARADVEREKSRNYDRYGKAISETAAVQKRSNDEIQELQADYNHRLERQKSTPPPSEENHHIEVAVNRQNRSHEDESRELRTQVKNLLQAEKEYGKEQGQGRTDARREIENDAKLRDTLIQNANSDRVEKLKRDNELIERVGNEKLTDALHERDLETVNLLRQANNERHGSDQMHEKNFSQFVQQRKILEDNEAKNHERQINTVVENLNEESARSLGHQASAYKSQLSDKEAQSAATIARLQKAIDTQRTSTDGSQVSPAYAEALRQSLTQEYEKLHQANVERMQEKNNELLQNYGKKLADVTQDKEQTVTRLNTQHQLENHQEQAMFTDHVTELEQNQLLSKRQFDAQSDRTLTNLNRNHSQVLDKQRQSYEQTLFETRNEAQQRIMDTNQKAGFDSKMAQRNFAQRENELIHTYEKKLADQKNLSEDQIGELKAQFTQTTHEAERRSKQMLDEQARGYEQRIQALEFQSKERERIVSENYQDQIEKMKRANALQQKKS